MGNRIEIKDVMSKTELITLVSKHVYPNEFNRNSDMARIVKNRVRARIDEAQKAGKLSKDNRFNPESFFRWAITQPKWGCLELALEPDFHNKIKPLKTQTVSVGMAVEHDMALPVKVHMSIDIPKKRKDLENLCENLNNKYWDLNHEYRLAKSKFTEQINQLERENLKLSNKVKYLTENDEKRRATNRKNGAIRHK